jgi:hypothetical protein
MKIANFEVDDYVNLNMSSLKGEIKTTYLELCELFGKPTYTDADPYEKVNAEWKIQAETTEGETVKFSIYNWKTGCIPTEEYEWHIGGFGYDAVEAAYELINGDGV